MIQIDIPMPKNCDECPISYYIQSGEFEGRLMCNALEFRESSKFRESSSHILENYLVNEWDEERPKKCPLKDGDRYMEGYENGRKDEASFRDGTMMQTFSP